MHAYVMGEHGDSEFVPWSQAMLATKPVLELCRQSGGRYCSEELDKIAEEVRTAAYKIIEAKRATYYGIGMALTRITRAVFGNESSVLTVSAMLRGEYGQKDVFVGVPCIVNRSGIQRVLELNLSEEEQARQGNYEYNTLKSANARIKELESQLASENGTTNANADYIADLEAQVKKLQKYKDSEDSFNKRVQEFDEKVVFNDKAPDISEYQQYYEQIQPDNAEKIYRQVIKKQQYTKKAETLGTYYANMDAAAAAVRLSEMSEDLDLVCDILQNMQEKKAAAILEQMDSAYAAQITKKISAVN